MDKQKFILRVSLIVFLVLAILNFLTVFTPEIGFDALWYHLTLPKLWLLKRQWYFSGGLLYYSVMPRLAETLFIPLISLTGFVGPKLVQFTAGLGAAYLTYKIALSLKLNRFYSLLSAFTFYITWLVSWQSGSAYVDLIRTFLEVTALWFYIRCKFIKGSFFLGLAIGTKWLALGSLAIFTIVFGPAIVFPALLIASPWFIIAYHFTGNPVYPLFEHFLSHTIPSIQEMLPRFFLSPVLLTKPVDDFLSPYAGVFLILTVIAFLISGREIKKVAAVGLLGTALALMLNPPSSRFLLPYFPALCISAMVVISRLKPLWQDLFSCLLIGSFIFVLSLRLYAFKKYVPYLTGKQSTNEFLTSLSYKLPDTFIDSDSFVKDSLKNKNILIDKLHNLYYFPYDFDHTSWMDPNKRYDFLITTGQKEDQEKTLIHTNPIGIQIFKLNYGRPIN